MLVGRFPVCCGTEALLLSSHGIDHYCTTAHFFMSSNANLGALISDNTTNSWNRRNHSILGTTAFHRTRASGPLCIENELPGDAIVDDVALTVFACRADRMHGIQSLGRAAAILHHHRPPLQCRIAVRGDVLECRVLVLVRAKYQKSSPLCFCMFFQVSSLPVSYQHGHRCLLDHLTWTG